ncbi:variable surface protein [Plasmodium gonderi]|uniref:Variable surface protein n=1 Tax=Plasmodium gonderi TaxID=77519 RepID=A0A1Y1JSR6_PLAGO|nr:variable surface protein [Plasmodium gonderi]GAW84197.1 variable surface protein [Plasmodium gonderi]
MDKFDYLLVKEFLKNKNILENNDNDLELANNPCSSYGSIGSYQNIGEKFPEHRCKKALTFASKIKDEYYNFGYAQEDCLYLYYWLYNEFKAYNMSQHTFDIYFQLINAVHGPNNMKCRYYRYTSISEIEIQLLDDLYGMYTNLHYIETSSYPSGKIKCNCITECSDKYEVYHEKCKSNNTSSFCRALDDIKNKYNKMPNLTDGCDNIKCKMLPCDSNENIRLPSPKIKKSITAILSTILILIIPILLFIIYKFLPCNSSMHRGIKKIMNKCRGKYKECNKSQNSEISNSIYWNNNYNVLYSST